MISKLTDRMRQKILSRVCGTGFSGGSFRALMAARIWCAAVRFVRDQQYRVRFCIDFERHTKFGVPLVCRAPCRGSSAVQGGIFGAPAHLAREKKYTIILEYTFFRARGVPEHEKSHPVLQRGTGTGSGTPTAHQIWCAVQNRSKMTPCTADRGRNGHRHTKTPRPKVRLVIPLTR